MTGKDIFKNRQENKIMYPNKVEICGINTSSLPVMKDVQMDEMIEKIRSGDTGLREKFITGNLRLVLSVIQKFQNRGDGSPPLFLLPESHREHIDSISRSLLLKASVSLVSSGTGYHQRLLRITAYPQTEFQPV